MAVSVALRSFDPAIAGARPVTFAEAVRDHQDEVCGVALRITGDRESALDVPSATFLKAYRAFARYDQSRPIRHWLLRIASNEAISHARRASRELYRVVILLRYFNDLSVEEIAEVTGRPASTVGVQLLRGRALLRRALGDAQ